MIHTSSKKQMYDDMRIAIFSQGNYNHSHAPELSDKQLAAAALVVVDYIKKEIKK